MVHPDLSAIVHMLDALSFVKELWQTMKPNMIQCSIVIRDKNSQDGVPTPDKVGLHNWPELAMIERVSPFIQASAV